MDGRILAVVDCETYVSVFERGGRGGDGFGAG